LFDWNRVDAQGRPRPLHIEESLASIHWDQGPIDPVKLSASGPLVSCPHFEIARMRWTGEVALGGVDRLQALIVTEGQGRFANGEFVMPGDAWVLPAAMPDMTLSLEKPISGLLCTLPA
jgi:mannose-6-phosphate isomerase